METVRAAPTQGPEAVPVAWDKKAGLQVQSNSPETITALPELSRGYVGVSTLDGAGRSHPEAHLNQSIQGNFSVAASHNNKSGTPAHQNIVLQNRSDKPVTVELSANVSHNSSSRSYVDPEFGTAPYSGHLSGPGAHVARDQAAGQVTQGESKFVIPPGGTWVVRSEPHASGEVMSQVNGRSSGPIGVAVLYSDKQLTNDPKTGSPEAAALLKSAKMLPLGDYEKNFVPDPAPPEGGNMIFGRAAGVASAWKGQASVTNNEAGTGYVARPNETQSFHLLHKATGQGQEFHPGKGYKPGDSAPPLVARYAHSAHAAHGAYFTNVDVSIPLINPSNKPVKTRVYLDGPKDDAFVGTLTYRGTVNVKQPGASDQEYSVALRPGTRSERPFIEVLLRPGECRQVSFTLANGANNTVPLELRLESSAAE